MNNVLNIISRQSLVDAIHYFSPKEVDFFHSENTTNKRGVSLYYISIGLKKEISPEIVAEKLAELIIFKYEKYILRKILKKNFIDFTDQETNKIINVAQNSIAIFNQLYNKCIIVKNLTDLIKISDCISIEGFFNFRAKEYKHMAEMIISDAIEQLFIEEEYQQFIDILKSYVSFLEPQIELLHIKLNSDGSFSFYNFKMERIELKFDAINSIEISTTNQDILMSILLTFVPRRIIWHNNSEFKSENIKSTIQQIFEERFSVCKGCELCKNKR